MSIPSAPNIYSLRSFISRPERDPGQQRIVVLVLQTLNSYPLMIVHHNTLPPFIHPYSIDYHDEEEDTESLDSCLNLMHMLGSKIRGSSKLFWKNVRRECERMREQHTKMDTWALLSAMQALSVYLLVRLREGETEHNNYDSLMLTTVIMLAQELTRTASACDIESTVRDSSNGTGWKAWVLQESRRRLAVIYRVVNMLVYFEPADMCELQKELIIAPLPAKKQLWEAANMRTWQELLTRDKQNHEHVALNSHGELVLLEGDKLYCHNGVMRYRISSEQSSTSKTTDWEHWSSGMDGFGSLIMLTASLIV
ncbi:hypothetical protein E4T44_00282 [Aureobasidium sp. EXF-8845]|nr:hypothetical protein E4T44_00282 [Aureobasidium sp. EXF-8845]KAI4858214.1 hypothetical protein E4T45_00272 [Aureobasidium sp. EXF-8846]